MTVATRRSSDTAGLHALVVDDERNMRFMARVTLESIGFDVEEAPCGDVVLDRLDELRPDVVLLDVAMPGADGFDVCSALRSRPEFKRLPIIMMTGLDDHESITRAYEAGATDFIVKPVNWELVKHRVRYTIRASVDAGALARAKRAATHMAFHDSLTGLPNRRYFNKRLSEAIERAAGASRSAGVLCLDLDGFKRVNDTFGHDVGDSVLETVASRVQRCLRITDGVGRKMPEESPAVSRLGGDEFTIVVEGIHRRSELVRIARRVRAAISAPMEIADSQLVRLTPSIGISVYPDDGLTVEQLVKNADLAMYHAKRKGRNNFQFFTDDLEVEIKDRMAIEVALAGALQRGEFELEYQPIFQIDTGRLEAVEALLRWRHAALGDVTPSRFVSVAEEIGLMGALGEWVMRTACAQSRAWQDLELGQVCVAVNVSAVQLRQPGFATSVGSLLQELGLSPEALQLELTESLLMGDTELSDGLLAQLRDLGVRVAADDFGTGCSSLSYLHRFKPDVLKIDRSFIGGLGIDAERRSIVSAVLVMAEALSLRVIAEGVERRSELEYLRARGCAAAQGFLLARPGPPSEVEALLRAQRSGQLPEAWAA